MLRKLLFTFSFSVIACSAFTQISLNYLTADEAVATLLGPNIQFSNVTFSGDANQLGYFDATNSNVGIASGIILGTGDISNAEGPNDSGSNSVGGGNFGASDADLDDLDGLNHNDAAILEFDFIANGSVVSFDYVWASEEYPEYTGAGDCGDVSDVFGFFLSGPGISGPFSNNADNIALIPGTNDFVSIFNLNAGCEGTAVPGDADCNNCEFYINNGNGTTAPFNTDNFYVQYDGLTVVLTAIYDGLVCGETYHIKLAVADVSDTAFDSAVFLQEGSFSIGGQLIQPIVVNPVPNFPPFTVLEGCVQGQFVISPPSCIIEELVLNITIGGTATLGADYTTNLTDQLVFQPGDPSVTIDIMPILDDFQEDLETITISFDYIGLDGEPATASATLNLIDYQDPIVPALPNLFICPNSTETATAQTIQGYPPYSYEWSSGQSTATATFSEGDSGEYTVTSTDACGGVATNTLVVTEPEAPFETLADTVYVCISDNVGAIATGGVRPYTYSLADPADSLFLNYIPETLDFNAIGLTNPLDLARINVVDSCNQEITVWVSVITCGTFIPDIFTPNGDGKNDSFEIVGVQRYPGSSLKVYNRHGTLVYENDNYNNTFRGQDLEDGTYFYIFVRSDGEVSSGPVTMLR